MRLILVLIALVIAVVGAIDASASFFIERYDTGAGVSNDVAWYGSYSTRYPLEINTSVDLGVNYLVPINLYRGSRPLETGSWSDGGNTYNNRVELNAYEGSNVALTDYGVSFYINHKWLVDNGYSTVTANEIRFGNSTTVDVYEYQLVSGADTDTCEFTVQLTFTAAEKITFYLYCDADLAIASESDTLITWAQYYEEFNSAANTANFTTVYPDWSLFGGPAISVSGGVATITCDTNLTLEGIQFDTLSSTSRLMVEAKVNSIQAHTYILINGSTDDRFGIWYNTGTADEIINTKDAVAAWTNANYPATPFIVRMTLWGNKAKVYYVGQNPDEKTEVTGFDAETYKARVGGYTSTNSIAIDWIKIGLYTQTPPHVDAPDLAAIYLEDNCENYPYDIAFCAGDGVTPLDWDTELATEISAGNRFIECVFEYDGNLTAAGSPHTAYVYCGDASITTWEAEHTDTIWDVFEDFSDISDWTQLDGTWTSVTQQRPIFLGGFPWRWVRNPCLDVIGSNWIITGLYGITDGGGADQDINQWPTPFESYRATCQTSDTSMSHWYQPSTAIMSMPGWCAGAGYYISSTYTHTNGYKYITIECTGGSGIGVANTTDLETINEYAGNPVVEPGDIGWGYGVLIFDGCLDYFNGVWFLFYTTTVDLGGGYTNGEALGVFTAPDWYGPYTDRGMILAPTQGWQRSVPWAVIENVDVVHYYDYTSAANRVAIAYSGAGAAAGPQRIGIATMAESDYDTGIQAADITDHGEITLTEYAWNIADTGTPRLYPTGDSNNTCILTYYGQGETPDDEYGQDNSAGYAIGNLSSRTFTAQNTDPMMYQSVSDPDFEEAIITGGSYSNVRITTEMMLADGERIMGIIFRYQDANNFYVTAFDHYMQRITWGYLSGGVPTTGGIHYLWDDPNFKLIQSGSIYRLRVITRSDDSFVIQYSMHGDLFKTAFDISDSTLPSSGGVGLRTYDSAAYFDNLSIKTIGSTECTVTLGSAQNIGFHRPFIFVGPF